MPSEPPPSRTLEEQFDPEVRFRRLLPAAGALVGTLLFALSCFHYYTAGFGLLREQTHRGIHMAFVVGLIFLVFAFRQSRNEAAPRATWLRPGGISWIEWLLAAAAALASLYVPYVFDDLAFRVGNPLTIDVVMGSVMIVVLLEATRRSLGWPLPVIALAFIAYAFWGRYMPGILVHPGNHWAEIVNHLYLTSQGIYGTALGVVATFVFHYVLFGVLATRIGLGRLFIGLALCVAGRYAGGPAKVAIFGSGLFGMISGSSIANTVTVGSLTIPMMIRLGYPRHFAAAVESTASTGGQITPPIMGAAAFLMVEYLNLPYQTIILAAIVPAFMHYFGVFMQVHFEAKRTGLRGLSEAEMPKARELMRQDWPTLLPLAVLIGVLFLDFTPYYAAFCGITACIAVGVLNPRHRLAPGDLVAAFVSGAKYAIAVGAAAATVGVIVGVITLTGVGLKITAIVTSYAEFAGAFTESLLPADLFERRSIVLFYTLILTAIVCVLLGCGIPTTATYIIMVIVAAPVLAQFGVAPLVAHFFVFYYGVLADVTPPVALAAYAGASMANADPFRTGNTAFRLALGKALVPFVFVYSPAMLLVTREFTWSDFLVTTGGCALGIVFLSAAFSRYFLAPMRAWECLLAAAGALLMVAPGLASTALGLAVTAPMLARQLLVARRAKGGPAIDVPAPPA
jgi:TRAP transporter 4TM/12TM fusion protein